MEGNLQKTFGRSLRAYRRAHGLSQEHFAEIIGVHRTYMGGVERGERNLTLKSIERIAARINRPAIELLHEPEILPAAKPAKGRALPRDPDPVS